jgi:hypothetical protein
MAESGATVRLRPSTQPLTRVGLAITAATDLAELVDLTSTATVAGTSVCPWFHAAAAATGSGAAAADVANAWVTALCDNALHLDDYEATSAIGVSGQGRIG